MREDFWRTFKKKSTKYDNKFQLVSQAFPPQTPAAREGFANGVEIQTVLPGNVVLPDKLEFKEKMTHEYRED